MTHVLHRHLRQRPPTAVAAQGLFITDAAGRRYIDASGGAAVSSPGRGHVDVMAAMHAQIDQLASPTPAFSRALWPESWLTSSSAPRPLA